jgi:hypothetical protein
VKVLIIVEYGHLKQPREHRVHILYDSKVAVDTMMEDRVLRELAVAFYVPLAGGGSVGWGGWSVGSVGARVRHVHVEVLQEVHLLQDLLLDPIELESLIGLLRVGLQEADVEAGEDVPCRFCVVRLYCPGLARQTDCLGTYSPTLCC